MQTRFLALIALLLLVVAAVVAKEKLDPNEIMARSDALYYYPAAHGVTDMAVEITVDQLAAHPVAKGAKITYYYAGEDKQRITVENIPDAQASLRNEILSLVSPMVEYLMPRPSLGAFKGLEVKAEKVAVQLAGVPGTQFYQLTGISTDKKADLQEYRVLLDQAGLAYQVETKMKDGNKVGARIENVQIGDLWHVARVTTRLMSKSGPQWKQEAVTYDKVDTLSLPTRVTTQFRNTYNQPIKGLSDLTFNFVNYRINKGVAAAVFAADAPKAPATEKK